VSIDISALRFSADLVNAIEDHGKLLKECRERIEELELQMARVNKHMGHILWSRAQESDESTRGVHSGEGM